VAASPLSVVSVDVNENLLRVLQEQNDMLKEQLVFLQEQNSQLLKMVSEKKTDA